jgi:hypothetical protein
MEIASNEKKLNMERIIILVGFYQIRPYEDHTPYRFAAMKYYAF